MGFPGGDLDTPPVLRGAWGRRGRRLAGWLAGGSGWAWLTPPSHRSSEWPREPQVPVYVPKFHSGWEPPLDVLQEAPWEVEGLAAAPADEVRALAATPRAVSLTSPLQHLRPCSWPGQHPQQAQVAHSPHSRLQQAVFPFEAPRSTASCLSPSPRERSSPQPAPHTLTGKLPAKSQCDCPPLKRRR